MRRITLMLLISLGVACSKKYKSRATADKQTDSRYATINLFQEAQPVEEMRVVTIALKEAVSKSVVVVFTTDIQRIECSDYRGGSVFFLYQVNRGEFIKSGGKHKNCKFPIRFISDKKLFYERQIHDSIYLFLMPMNGHKLLEDNLAVKYKWNTTIPGIIKRLKKNEK